MRYLVVFLLACSAISSPDAETGDEENLTVGDGRFPDLEAANLPADFKTQAKYSFKLSQDYPTALPQDGSYPWLDIDFTTDPDGYMLALRDYTFKGMVHKDDPEADFRPEHNKEAKWFHVPWMHPGGRGREWMHGLTRERDADPFRLGPNQANKVQDWGLGMYNDVGGYTIGQVWADANKPNAKKAVFAEGSVVFKILFSAADPVTEAPWLANSIAWSASINSSLSLSSKRTTRTVRLAQMDIAAKDSRAPIGWVYGTLVFDEKQPTHAEFGDYAKMMPIGIAYGNLVEESIVSPNIPEPAKRTLGWGGRINGPGDNPSSSCTSCHATAQWANGAPISPMTPPAGATEQEIERWFQDRPDTEAFDPGATSLQTSLQLQISLSNFAAKKVVKGPVVAGDDPRNDD